LPFLRSPVVFLFFLLFFACNKLVKKRFNAQLHGMTLHDAARRCTTLHDAARHCTTLHDAARRCTTLHDAARRCTTLHDAA
jgi:hypothetical protein